MEVGRSRSSCSIRRPGHPPPPPPPSLKSRLRNELEESSALQDSNPLTNLDSQAAPQKPNAPSRRAPPPPLPRALQIGTINRVLPVQPKDRQINCNLPSPPSHVRSTLSLPRGISATQIKTSIPPVSVVRPYNFPPLPTTPSQVESSENKSPEEDSFFSSLKGSAQHKMSPSFLDELQQAFPLLRQESKALTSHPKCASPGRPKCNKDDQQSESNSRCETSDDQDCLPNVKAASVADISKAPSLIVRIPNPLPSEMENLSTSPSINVRSQQAPFKRPPPPPASLHRRASVPVMSRTGTNPRRTVEKPVLSHPQPLFNSSFTKNTSVANGAQNISTISLVGKDQAHQVAPVSKSSSLRELTRKEYGDTTLPPPPRQRPPLPPRPQSFLLPAAPPPTPRRRESLLLEVTAHSKSLHLHKSTPTSL